MDELVRKIDKDEEEVHVFEDKEDPECPIVIWFTLASSSFKKKENYVRQKPIEGEKFGKLLC